MREARQLVICVRNDGHPVSLEKRKIYVAIPDAAARKLKLMRVVDESGEDYLYPADFLVEVTLPLPVRKAVLASARERLQAQRAELGVKASTPRLAPRKG